MQHAYTACLIATLMLLLAGCASTKKRYEKATELEAKGRYAEAADYYIRVLDKEPTWKDARSRLLDVGTRAVDAYLDQADAAAQMGHYEQALQHLSALDGLRTRAGHVGTTLAVPGDYEQFRGELTTGAVAEAVGKGEQAEQAQRWAEAIAAYERAQQRYAMPPSRRAELDQARFRVYMKWGEQEMLREHYRAAYDRAQQAIEIVGPEVRAAEPALRLQKNAVAAGTHVAAFLPLWATSEAAHHAPQGLLQELNDVLLYEHWSAPPLFIAPADPVAMHRELRRFRTDRTHISRSDAAEVGRVLEADFVVLSELAGFQRLEKDLREKSHRVKLRGRGPTRIDTTFVEQQFTLELQGAIAYAIVDPYSRRIIEEGTVQDGISGRLMRGIYGGDYRDLDLSTAERRFFDREEQRLAEHDLETRLIEQLSDRLAIHLYNTLLSRIP